MNVRRIGAIPFGRSRFPIISVEKPLSKLGGCHVAQPACGPPNAAVQKDHREGKRDGSLTSIIAAVLISLPPAALPGLGPDSTPLLLVRDDGDLQAWTGGGDVILWLLPRQRQ